MALLAALAVAGVFGSAGCGSAAEGPVSAAARAWFDAVRTGDGDAACALLVPRAAETVESISGQGCAAGVSTLGLPSGGVRSVEVWSDRAEVRGNADTLFLVRLAAGWRVSAAGCQPRPGQPYDCQVEV